MAGPCAGIYTKKVISENEKADIRRIVTNLGNLNTPLGSATDDCHITDTSSIEGSYLGDPMPFLIVYGFEYPEEPNECYLGLGWTPNDRLYFCAMCNGGESHQILGELCLFFAEKFSGTISFNGGIDDYTNDPKILSAEGVIDHEIETYFSPEAFRLWLKHPSFCMVK